MGKDREVILQEKRTIHTLVQCVEEFPQYTLSQHLWHILRTKGDGSTPYEWSADRMLKATEKYYDELVTELANGYEEE